MSDPTARFTPVVTDYAKYRPSYPTLLFDDLDRTAWTKDSVVADIGAGTGIFTRLVAPRVARVHAREPNGPMRTQGVSDSAGIPNIVWGTGTAEATGLSAGCLDAIVSAQAFHWFDPAATAAEWRRILKPGGHVVLVWNDRDLEAPIQAAYDRLLVRWCPEYPKVTRSHITLARIEAFFAPNRVTTLAYRNDQRFDLDGWKGRLRSSSYCPQPHTPGHAELMAGLDELFSKFKMGDGLVTFPYQTKAYLGSLT